MPNDLNQPSFARGELSPSLYGRVDLAAYSIGLRKAQNFIVRPYGGVDNRPGTQYIETVKTPTKRVRIIPFEYSTSVSYVIELGDLYMRFYSGGARLEVASVPVELATPWSESEIFDVHFTQSADVLTMVHPLHPPQKLSRTSATSFTLTAFEAKDGPFRDLNPDEAVKVAATSRTGNVTINANSNIFTADMVGGLFYIENRNFSNIKPWSPGERGLTLGVLRRSDGKTYAVSAIPTGLTWTETGGVRPTHDRGRAWDGGGPTDARTSGASNYYVGVEWEFQDFGFGVVQITSFTAANSVKGVVKKNLPAGVVGGVGSPGGSWIRQGDGATLVFSIPGATSSSYLDYTVTINGEPVTSGQGSGGSGIPCVSVDSILPGGIRAGDVRVGDVLQLFDPVTWTASEGEVTYSRRERTDLFRVVMASGITLECSAAAPIPVRRGDTRTPSQLMGHEVPIMIDDHVRWDIVVDIVSLGLGDVQHITCQDTFFWAGADASGYLLHHNIKNIFG